jgi:hypothetical protein
MMAQKTQASRGTGRPHLGRDERVSRLNLGTRIPAPGDSRHVHRLAICPDAPDAGDRPFGQPDREGGGIDVFGGGDFRPTTLAA